MNHGFKDHFSDKSAAYRDYRPGYPEALFSYLASQTQEHQRAWDCGTGSGQSAVALKDYFAEVIATDASANQINNATVKEGVIYKTEAAEHTSLADRSVDLITVAQAVHWFDLQAFSKEVLRVLKPHGVLAIWSYGLLKITPQIDAVIDELYGPVLERFWPPERRMIEEGYRNIQFPLQEMTPPEFRMTMAWTLPQLIGYLRTWSAVKRYETEIGANPVDSMYKKIASLWGDPEQARASRWPLHLRIWTQTRG